VRPALEPLAVGEPASIRIISPVTILSLANQPTFNLYASRITVPALVVWHQEDHCSFSPLAGSATLFALIPSHGQASRAFEHGHSVATDPCGAFSEHGYAGIEEEVVKKIAEFIRD
jgi:pimeloyl-ACP methyl ester carboxylesterase